LALIGCGRIAQVAHLPAMAKADGVELIAVCDPSEAVAGEVARRFGVDTFYTNAADLVADPAVEGVVIAAPDRFHFSIAAQALEAGKHVLVEKPLTSTSVEAAELVDLVDRTGLVLQVGAMKRHDQGMQYAKRFITERLGDLRSFNAWYRIGDQRAGIEATLFPPTISDPTTRATEAGFKVDRGRYLLATHGAHIFDTVRSLCGDVASVVVRHRQDGHDHEWQILVTTTAGAVGTIALAIDVPGVPTEGIECFGSLGTIRVDTPFPFYRQASLVCAYADGTTTIPTLTDGDPYERQVEAFARAICAGEPPTPDVRDGLAAVRLIEAVADGAESGLEVCL
jgi:predicted dehydrogenase